MSLALFYSITDYGASPSATAAENRVAILAAINAANDAGGGTVYIPDQEYIVTKTPGIAVFVLTGINNVTFRGEGIKSKITLEAGSYAGDTHIFSFTSSSNITFETLQLFGNRTAHSVSNEQMHGVRVFDCSYFYFDHVYFNQLRGDGVFLLGNTLTKYVWLNTCVFDRCGRSGTTIQRLNRYVWFSKCLFYEINDQAIDSEPTGGLGFDDVIISECIFIWENQRSIGVALGGSGSSNITFSKSIVVNAGINCTSVENLNIIDNPYIGGTISALESVDNFTIRSNVVVSTGKCINVYYQNEQPKNSKVVLNRCYTSSTTENGIDVQSDGVTVRDNKVWAVNTAGAGGSNIGSTGAGIIFRAPTVSESFYKELRANDNEVYNFDIGIIASASSSKYWKAGYFLNNVIKDFRPVKTITTGINLSGPAFYHFEELFIDKNSFDTSLSEANQILLNASGCSWYKITSRDFAGIVSPESVVSAQYNTIYNYIGLPYKYTKTVDGGSTGWVEKNLQLPNVIVLDELLENPQANINTHTPDTDLIGSLAWTNVVGQHDCLTTGEATAASLTGSVAVCTLNTGISDLTLQSVVRTGVAGNDYAGIVFRVADSSNYWAFEISAGLDTIRLIKVVAGSLSVVTSASVSVPASGLQVLRVNMKGNAISGSYNGGSQLSAYDNFNVTETDHGFISRVVTRYYFTDLKISI